MAVWFQLGQARNWEAKGVGNQTKALDQICKYAERMSVNEGYLVVFRKGMPDPEAVGQREPIVHKGKLIHLIWV